MKALKYCWSVCVVLLISTNLVSADEVIWDDLIANMSLCVGQDCFNGEEFEFDSIRLKENNLRQMFEDTSSSAEFPTNDWQIKINDSENGGESYFAILDCGPDYVSPTDGVGPMCGDHRYEVDPASADPLDPDFIITVPRAGSSVFKIEAGAPEDAFVIAADGTILVEGQPIGGGPDLGDALARIADLELMVADLAEQVAMLGKKPKKPKK
jgi:hypothetical protein